MRLCSACLLGIHCRYDGKSNAHAGVLTLARTETLIPVCPEQMGGLAIPRPPAERRGNRMVNARGEDVTAQFEKGAQETLRIALLVGATGAILKQRSPSCGSGQIYDGSFSGRVIPGDGVTTAVLREAGLTIWSEEDFCSRPSVSAD